jgi:hypothetical protein
MTKISQLPESTSITTADEFVCVTGGVTKRAKASVLTSDVAKFGQFYEEISTTKYTAAPNSTSRILMSDTSDMEAFRPLRYTYNSNVYYGLVAAISSNTHIDVLGATLNTGQALTKLEIGTKDAVVQMPFFISGVYGNGTDATLLASDMNAYVRWKESDAYLVQYEVTHKTADTGGTQPKVQVYLGGNAVSTDNTNTGVSVHATPGTWTESSAIGIHTTNYAIARNESIEIGVTAGSNSDAANLSGNLVFVLKG